MVHTSVQSRPRSRASRAQRLRNPAGVSRQPISVPCRRLPGDRGHVSGHTARNAKSHLPPRQTRPITTTCRSAFSDIFAFAVSVYCSSRRELCEGLPVDLQQSGIRHLLPRKAHTHLRASPRARALERLAGLHLLPPMQTKQVKRGSGIFPPIFGGGVCLSQRPAPRCQHAHSAKRASATPTAGPYSFPAFFASVTCNSIMLIHRPDVNSLTNITVTAILS